MNALTNRLWPYILGSITLGLDAYVIAGLLPSIAADLNSTPGTIGLGVAAFTSAYAIAGPLLAGAAAGIYSPLSSAVAASSVPTDHRGRALSLVLAGLACGTVLGVPLGILVAERSSWRWTFMLIAAAGAVATLGVALRGKNRIENIAAPSLTARCRTLSTSTNVLTMLVTLLTGIASLGLYTYLAPLLHELGHETQQIWLIWVWGLGGALGALCIGRIIDTVSRPAALTAGITALLSTSFLLIALNVSLPLTALSIFLWGLLGWASLAPQQHTLMTTNPHDATTAIAANASANYLGSALGSLAGATLINNNITASALCFSAAAVALLAFLIQLVRIRIQPSP